MLIRAGRRAVDLHLRGRLLPFWDLSLRATKVERNDNSSYNSDRNVRNIRMWWWLLFHCWSFLEILFSGGRTMLSSSCEYALRAMLYLATLDSDGYVSVQTISDELDISFPFLTKVFQNLNDAGLLESRRGPNGGVALTKSADTITLYDIVVAIDGRDLFEECVLGLPGCGEAEPCPLHEEWSDEKERVERTFRESTLGDLPEARLAGLT